MKFILRLSFVIAVLSFFYNAQAQSTIGTRNGTSYTIIDTRYVYEANAAYCGYNDLSIPNSAKFKIETLRFEQYDNGKFIRSWTEERKTYVGCYNP